MITINNLCFSYNGAQPYILEHLNLEIEQGEYISIIGENGSGKSTLMRLLLGFLKPTIGSIVMNKNRIGYVPQKNDFSNTNFPITVFEAMNSYRRLLKIKEKDVILHSLQQVGMSEYGKSLMGDLSGGQTQKILIARALMGEPDLLILDEPSTGVDIESQKEIYQLLKRLTTEKGKTIIAVEHNLEAVFHNSTKIFHLKHGSGHLCDAQNYIKEYVKNKEGGEDDVTI
ncbi:metal ABC transporter ATP-binding protein [Anaeromicropila herbilytica]|uniref:ABC transporter ATP-binding protein n=1 Tax=Anaeromicropila herbilytica TaxID=2785025 RepID=A0A7R7IDN5_9FIRM|nr:metal ABC transporter ATP-binding protein [Anaeromicropila herbilytica]BCN31146.1 ABC transporter ATP-binding protein [Anaeromicropila herbilytica]